MKIRSLSLRIASVIAFGVAAFGLASPSPAAERPSPQPKAVQEAPPAKKKQTSGPFHGKLAALDRQAATITVGKRTFQVVASTKITKAGKAATLNDGVLGETASGYFRMNEEGKLVLASLRFGPKPEGEGASSKSPAKK